jgi:hypothetical protein
MKQLMVDFMVSGFTYSNDGDVSGNHSNGSDAWVIKLSYLELIFYQQYR